MTKIPYGSPNEIPTAEVRCPMDEFENAIRKIGVVNACEWFGHSFDSGFTKETVEILLERSGIEYSYH